MTTYRRDWCEKEYEENEVINGQIVQIGRGGAGDVVTIGRIAHCLKLAERKRPTKTVIESTVVAEPPEPSLYREVPRKVAPPSASQLLTDPTEETNRADLTNQADLTDTNADA